MPRGQDDFSYSPLQTFFAKVAIVTGAVLISVYYVSSVSVSFAEKLALEINTLGVKGGPAFWGAAENKLYALADAPDLPLEKKQRIIDAIQKLSVKYKPYVDALVRDGAAAKPERMQDRQ